MPFERIVDSPEGVGDLYQDETLICQAQYHLRLFQDFVPSNGLNSPYVPSSIAPRIDGLLHVPAGITLQPMEVYSLRLPNERRVELKPCPGQTEGTYTVN